MKYKNMSPEKAEQSAEFNGKFFEERIDGDISFVVKIIEKKLINKNGLLIWVKNEGKRPVELSYYSDKVSYFIDDVEYYPINLNKSSDYPKILNPGAYFQYGKSQSILFPKDQTGKITAIGFHLDFFGKKFELKF